MAEITEQQDIAQQISDAISKPVGFGDDVDEVMKARSHLQQEGGTVLCFVGCAVKEGQRPMFTPLPWLPVGRAAG